MTVITKADHDLMDEILEDPIALQMLKDKCNWESMGRYAVLSEWGDPRLWADYKRSKENDHSK